MRLGSLWYRSSRGQSVSLSLNFAPIRKQLLYKVMKSEKTEPVLSIFVKQERSDFLASLKVKLNQQKNN